MNSTQNDPNLFPPKDFDLIKEGSISLVIVVILIVIVASIWKAPYSPAITNQQIANTNPVYYAKLHRRTRGTSETQCVQLRQRQALDYQRRAPLKSGGERFSEKRRSCSDHGDLHGE